MPEYANLTFPKQMIDYLKYEINIANREKQAVQELVQTQTLTVEDSERLLKEIAKVDINKNKLIQAKNEKANMKYKLIQTLDDLINEVL